MVEGTTVSTINSCIIYFIFKIFSMDQRLTKVLSRLGGVYRDPSRINRDATSLLRSSVGQHLSPVIDSLFENDGKSHQTLCLRGTVAIHYRGATYQQLVDLYLPAGYPARPPICFVRLAPNMYIKDAHQQVGADGQVYLPYLHEWKPHSHNLVEMVVAMSSTFSADPPVFTRAPPPPPPPPDYYSAFAENVETQGVTPERTTTNSTQQKEDQLLKEVEEASRLEAIAVAKKKSEEAERERQLAIQEDFDAKNFATVKDLVKRKILKYLTNLNQTTQELIQIDWQEKQLLEQSTNKLERQLNDLTTSKITLEQAVDQVDLATTKITTWLEHAEAKQQEQNETETETSIDDMVTPVSTVHKQMLELAAENISLTDAMYFLDQALLQTTIDIQTYLKEIRTLAKKQFLVKAHLLKISQTMALQNIY